MANNAGLTLGARQVVCLTASDIGFRSGSEVVPVIGRGHVRVSSNYGITGPAGYGLLFGEGNPRDFDTIVDIYATEYSRAYLEVGASKIRRFVK